MDHEDETRIYSTLSDISAHIVLTLSLKFILLLFQMKVTWTFNLVISKDSYTPWYFLYLVNHLKNVCDTVEPWAASTVSLYTHIYERSLVERLSLTKLSVYHW